MSKPIRVTVVRDGDPKGSAPDTGLTKGLDHLLSQGAVVYVTATPVEEEKVDANAILHKQGLAALISLFAGAKQVKLSPAGEIRRLATLDPVDADVEIQRIAKGLGFTPGELRKAVAAARRAARPPKTPGTEVEPEDQPWTGPIDVAATATKVAARIPRYLVASDHHANVMTIWALVSHVVQDENIALPIMPQLGFQAEVEAAGKSVALEIVKTLAYRGQLRSSYTAATIFRFIHESQVTFALSELQHALTPHNHDMRAIINACHRRSEAFVDRVENMPDGSRKPVSFTCWAALAWGAIGALNPEVTSRSIILPLVRALPEESKKLLHTAPERDPLFNEARREFGAWARAQTAWPDPVLPNWLHGRLADNWRPLFAATEIIGGDWPSKIREAAEFLQSNRPQASEQVKLLACIKRAFGKETSLEAFISTGELINNLVADEEADYGTANNNKQIDAYWLRKHLRPLLNPPRSLQNNYLDEYRERRNERGYRFRQFTESFLRFLPPDPSPSSASSASVIKKPPQRVDGYDGFSEADGPSVSASEKAPVPSSTCDSFSNSEADEADAGGGTGEKIKSPTTRKGGKEKRESPGAGLKAHLRSTRRKSNGAKQPQPGLDMPEPPLGQYEPGFIDAEIRRLRVENPKRSLGWIAKQVGCSQTYAGKVLEAAP